MKKLIMICSLVTLFAAYGSTVKAEYVNPAEWDFYLESYGGRVDDGPLSPQIELDWEKYDYSWQITDTQLEVMDSWFAGPTGLSGSGSLGPPDPIPFTDEIVYRHRSPEVGFNVLASVDSSGYGTISLDRITFGEVERKPVTGIKVQGNVTVTGVPEPATGALFLLGSLYVFVKNKNRNRASAGLKKRERI